MRRICIVIVLIFFFIPFISFAENKTALVIGNGAYQHFHELSKPRPEAKEMKNTLESLGFNVILVLDGTYEEMLEAIQTFETKLIQKGGVGFFHYGGHGVQVRGENYLLPVDKDIPDELRVKSRAINVSEVVGSMKTSGTSSNIIILDACRDNPLPATTRSAGSRGLAKLEAPINSLVVFSAEAGKTAQDGVFTPTLIEYLKIPGMDINEVMMKVRRAVYEKTEGKQVPGEYSQLFEPVYLAGTAYSADGNTPDLEPKFALGKAYGTITFNTVTPGTLYLDNSKHGEVPQGGAGEINDIKTGTCTIEMHYSDGTIEEKQITVLRDRITDVYFTYRPKSAELAGFILVEAGSFIMGFPEITSVDSEEENDDETTEGEGSAGEGNDSDNLKREVRISKDFFISKFEVTQAEYREIMGTNPSVKETGIGDDHPVNGVSWYDAVEFCNKLSIKEGLKPCYKGRAQSIQCDFSANGYRLPTEAEWEYAARGGRISKGFPYAGSEDIDNVGWYMENAGLKCHPVGEKQPNELGIYDMSGNVWEWCWDWHASFPAGAVADPTGPSAGSTRVCRGGCFFDKPDYCGTNFRNHHDPILINYPIGFRLVRMP